jgi:hypothetical protein
MSKLEDLVAYNKKGRLINPFNKSFVASLLGALAFAGVAVATYIFRLSESGDPSGAGFWIILAGFWFFFVARDAHLANRWDKVVSERNIPLTKDGSPETTED